MDERGEMEVIRALSDKTGTPYHGFPVTFALGGEHLRFVDIEVSDASSVADTMNALASNGLVDGYNIEPETPTSPRFVLKGVTLPLIHLEDINAQPTSEVSDTRRPIRLSENL